MTTKKTTTKKTVKKVPAFKPHKIFDLNIKTQAQANELIAHLEIMKNTAGWLILKQILEGNMAVLERSIVLKKDPVTGEKLTDVQCDELRYKHGYLEELVGKPDELINMFKKSGGIVVPTYDPYATDAKQLRGDGSVVGAPMAHTLGDE